MSVFFRPEKQKRREGILDCTQNGLQLYNWEQREENHLITYRGRTGQILV